MKIYRHSSYHLKIISFLILIPIILNYVTQQYICTSTHTPVCYPMPLSLPYVMGTLGAFVHLSDISVYQYILLPLSS